MNVHSWLTIATDELKASNTSSSRLDAEIILAHTIGHPRTWLHAHGDETIDPRRLDIANARVELRLEHVPIAYIIGQKEFYGRRFIVTPDTLIPRPDSEILIDLLKKYACDHDPHGSQLIDVGTGSGCLGITAKLELPELSVTLSDISKKALVVAEKNAATLNADVRTLKSDLLDSYPLRARFVLANLPYVDRQWTVSADTTSEPDLALYTSDHGLHLIKKLITSIDKYLTSDGIVLLEADPRQHAALIDYAHSHRLKHLETDGFGTVLSRD